MTENYFNAQTDPGQSYSVQRTVPRYSVLAVAELVETSSTMCIVGRMTEISRKGCYVNTPSTLPINNLLKVVISRDDESFMTDGRVIYVHAGIGMGIVFTDTNAEQLEILNSWLAGAARLEAV